MVGFLALPAVPLHAVIIRGGDGSGNTTAPADDPGWIHVGRTYAGLSCVYLGNSWVLTAAHCRVDDDTETATFNGVTYNLVGSSIRLHEAGDPAKPIDLSLYQIDDLPPGLTSLPISSATPASGATVTGAGYGYDRAATETYWNYSWVEGVPPPIYRGFWWLGTRTKRWGQNLIHSSGFTINVGWGENYVIRTIFDQSGGSGDHEFQVAIGDSGGALFYKNAADVWELTGIFEALNRYSGQPEDTAVYGNSSYAIDLSCYRDQIVAEVQVFQFDGILDNPNATIGSGWQNAQLLANGGFGALTGYSSIPVDLNGFQFTFQSDSSDVTYDGALSGAGDLIVQGGDPLLYSVTLQGVVANTYTGTTTLQSGQLVLDKPAGVSALSGSQIIVQSNAVLQANAPQQIHDTTPLNLEGYFFLNGHDQTIGALSGSGGTIDLGTGNLTVNATAEATFSGQISGAGNFEKAGDASLTLDGSLDYTGDTIVSAGSLTVGDLLSSDEVIVGPGAQLHAQSIVSNTLTVGAGGRMIIQPLTGSPLFGGVPPPSSPNFNASTAVPEPGTFWLLLLGALALMGYRFSR